MRSAGGSGEATKGCGRHDQRRQFRVFLGKDLNVGCGGSKKGGGTLNGDARRVDEVKLRVGF